MIEQTIHSRKLDALRRRINDETYLHAAVQRLALVLSKELIDINMHQRCAASKMPEGRQNERQRKRRK